MKPEAIFFLAKMSLFSTFKVFNTFEKKQRKTEHSSLFFEQCHSSFISELCNKEKRTSQQ